MCRISSVTFKSSYGIVACWRVLYRTRFKYHRFEPLFGRPSCLSLIIWLVIDDNTPIRCQPCSSVLPSAPLPKFSEIANLIDSQAHTFMPSQSRIIVDLGLPFPRNSAYEYDREILVLRLCHRNYFFLAHNAAYDLPYPNLIKHRLSRRSFAKLREDLTLF